MHSYFFTQFLGVEVNYLGIISNVEPLDEVSMNQKTLFTSGSPCPRPAGHHPIPPMCHVCPCLTLHQMQ